MKRRPPWIRHLSAAVLLAAAGRAFAADVTESLADFTLEQLSNLQVTSVSKVAEELRQAPASIYVITHDDIIRAGVTSVAEALRLAPNLQLSQYTSNEFVAGARGMAGAPELQNFSNKLLILIDGRSVYSPLYSGVWLDVQDVLLEDVDRIEVISGPGATLWGANAMHGVINIITREAWLTEGGSLRLGAGTHERIASVRYGQRHENLAWRVYGKGFRRDALELTDGSDAGDEWNKTQGGFRVDWSGSDDTLTVQGDLYEGRLHEMGTDSALDGLNLLGRWQHRTARGSEWQLQSYYDRTKRGVSRDGASFTLDTYDLDFQHRWSAGRHRLVWGGGVRRHSYEFSGSPSIRAVPSSRDLTLANAFAQDTLALGSLADLTVGLKAERDAFEGWNLLPDLRLSVRPNERLMLWTGLSRAIRSPTPFDRDAQEFMPNGAPLIVADPDFRPERVDTAELGLRTQWHPSVSVSASVFANRYEDLRTVLATPVRIFPLSWDNGIEGWSYGAEAWAKWQVRSWWRLSPGIRVLDKDLRFAGPALQFAGLEQTGNDPRWQALLTSSMDFGPRWRLEATLRHVDDLPQPHLSSWTELDASIAVRVGGRVFISLTGRNLLHERHQEYPAPRGEFVPRSLLVQLRWRPET